MAKIRQAITADIKKKKKKKIFFFYTPHTLLMSLISIMMFIIKVLYNILFI